MKISFVVAKSKNNVIGNKNQLPWHLPADLAHFKALTLGKPIIMGRKTFDSIGKPLPGRQNIVITRDTTLTIDGCDVFHSIEDALIALKDHPEVMIIGGENLFLQTIDRAHCIYLTVIDAEFEGDTFFPSLTADWRLSSEEKHSSDEKNKFGCSFQVWVRV